MAKITYTTRTLAEAMIPDADDNIKQATRTLRKFLRDELGEGKAVVGKGGRYALEYGAPELRALKKKFAAWEIAQAEAKAARAAALEAAKTPATPEIALNDANDDESDNDDNAPEGPSDAEIAAMLSDDDETPDNA
jgi:hypothetical protein